MEIIDQFEIVGKENGTTYSVVVSKATAIERARARLNDGREIRYRGNDEFQIDGGEMAKRLRSTVR